MSILRLVVKFKSAKKVTNKALGDEAVSAIAAAEITKKVTNIEQEENKFLTIYFIKS
ncbi:hypothetical protein [Carnobacterium maltaromaticum]|uniref:hypothetical protein n=1 Tax=Carnobacterium maltaromaticum TaxID=2751 RepID=UPI0018CE0876|nr:hypothetical protein [Carnobacterium maltaromaticum]